MKFHTVWIVFEFESFSCINLVCLKAKEGHIARRNYVSTIITSIISTIMSKHLRTIRITIKYGQPITKDWGKIWQYGLWSFQTGGTDAEKFLKVREALYRLTVYNTGVCTCNFGQSLKLIQVQRFQMLFQS